MAWRCGCASRPSACCRVGTWRSTRGDVYEGEWRDGHKDGKGKLTTADGDVYEGQFKGGKREGEGIERMAGGDVYEGQWREGVKVRAARTA